jgi:hypothetical protein
MMNYLGNTWPMPTLEALYELHPIFGSSGLAMVRHNGVFVD